MIRFAWALLAAGLLAPLAAAQSAGEVFQDVQGRWQSEDAGGIARYFDRQVYIGVGRFRENAGREKASGILRDYFGSVQVRQVSIPPGGMGPDTCVFEQVVADERGERRSRFYVSLVNTGQGLRITSIRE